MTSLHQLYSNTFAPRPSDVSELDTSDWRWTQWLGADSTAMVRRPDGAILIFCGDTFTTSVPNNYAFDGASFTNNSLLYALGGRFGVEYANGTGLFDSPGTNLFGSPNPYLPGILSPGGFRWGQGAFVDIGTDGRVHLMATEYEGSIFTSYTAVNLREYVINQDLTIRSSAFVPGLAPQISFNFGLPYITTITSNIADTGTTSFTIDSIVGIPYGVESFYVMVESEKMLVTRAALPKPSQPFANLVVTIVERGALGTTAVAHASGSTIYPAYQITWGHAVIVDYSTNYTYIFGTYQVPLDGNRVVVCRRYIAFGSLPNNTPDFWDGSEWSDNMQDVVALGPTPGNSLSVIQHPAGGWLMTSCNKGLFTNKISAWWSETLNGTWTDPVDIYTIPSEFTDQLNYGGLSYITDNNKLRLMYNLNGPTAQIKADYRRYGIRWAEVEIPKK